MITKNELKYYSSLLQKKYRKTENKFIVEGENSVLEGINSNHRCEVVLATDIFHKQKPDLITFLNKKADRIIYLKEKEFSRISDTKSPQGIAAVFLNKKNKFNLEQLVNDKIIVYLDKIADPGNLGTVIRNCDWFGVNSILLSENTAEYSNPKVLRSSMGSVFHLDLYENVQPDSLRDLDKRGFEVLLADLKGESIFDYSLNKKLVLILSNEANGPSKEISDLNFKRITIPTKGKSESLNVASASAVILAELTK